MGLVVWSVGGGGDVLCDALLLEYVAAFGWSSTCGFVTLLDVFYFMNSFFVFSSSFFPKIWMAKCHLDWFVVIFKVWKLLRMN